MTKTLFALGVLALLMLAGCSKSDTPPVDKAAAQAQPGADAPAAQPAKVNKTEMHATKDGG